MADTFRNPYNYTSPIGSALADLTRTIISGPSRAEKIRATEEMLKVKRANENLLAAQAELGKFGTPDFGLPAFASAALGAGISGSDLADYNLALTADGSTWDSPEVDAAYRGAGGAASGTGGAFKLGEANAMTRHADALAQQESEFGRSLAAGDRRHTDTVANDRWKFEHTPFTAIGDDGPEVFTNLTAVGKPAIISETENKAYAARQLFPNLTDLEQRRYIGVDPSMTDFANLVSPDGSVAIADPAAAQAAVGKPGFAIVGKEGAAGQGGLTTGTQTEVQKQLIDLDMFDADLDAAIGLVSEMPESAFGATGNVKLFAQNAKILADNIASGLGFTAAQDAIEAFEQEAMAAGMPEGTVLSHYDPRMPELSTAYIMLAYRAARVQSGGGMLSDRDVANGFGAAGNPLDLFASKQSLLAKANALKAGNARRRAVLTRATGGTVASPEPLASQPPTRYRNPDTGEEVEWNGSEWVGVR